MDKQAIIGKAASIDGAFSVQRTLSGDKVWVKGDVREGKIGDLIHLVETGAILADNEDTAKACSIMLGRDVRVGEMPDPEVRVDVVLGEAASTIVTEEAIRAQAAQAAQEEAGDAGEGQKAEAAATLNKAEKPATANKSAPRNKAK